jgi:molybdopterin synthase catalytic subunit
MPIERSSLTECCVGLVFSSPAPEYTASASDAHRCIAARQLIAELADRLEERQRLDVAHRAADLAQHEIIVLIAVEHEGS